MVNLFIKYELRLIAYWKLSKAKENGKNNNNMSIEVMMEHK